MKSLRELQYWKQPKFRVALEKASHRGWYNSCGSGALSMIVNRCPADLEAQYLGIAPRDDFPRRTMRKALKEHGWEVMELEPRDLVNTGDFMWAHDFLTPEHVVLMTCDTTKSEASWFLMNRNSVWHNGKVWTRSPLFCLTNPVIDFMLLRRKNK